MLGRLAQRPLAGVEVRRMQENQAGDPAGCHVATTEGQLVGANFSVTRGTVGLIDESFSTGVVGLSYQPAGKEGEGSH